MASSWVRAQSAARRQSGAWAGLGADGRDAQEIHQAGVRLGAGAVQVVQHGLGGWGGEGCVVHAADYAGS